jgi:hypothetical protein
MLTYVSSGAAIGATKAAIAALTTDLLCYNFGTLWSGSIHRVIIFPFYFFSNSA